MCGLIALSTNWLAIKMLFRPHKAKYILGLKLPFTPGLIPKERAKLAKKLAEAISTRLLTPEVLAAELTKLSTWQFPNITIREALAAMGIENPTLILGEKLKEMTDTMFPKILAMLTSVQLPAELDDKLAEITYKIIDENVGTFASIFISKEKIYTSIKTNTFEYLASPENHDFIREKLYDGIELILSHEIAHKVIEEKLALNIQDVFLSFQRAQKEKHAVFHVFEKIILHIAKSIPIAAMIENKLNSFEVAEAEDLILTVAGRELKLIILLGGVLGFLIGGLMVIF